MGKKYRHHQKGTSVSHSPPQQPLPYTAPSGNVASAAFAKRCYHDHPPYEIAPGLTIYGGSGNFPAVEDADVYIGFDHGMRRTKAQFPWNDGPVEVWFKITDMSVPEDRDEFDKMLDWTAAQLKEGKKVHAGCIGGHGRTGLFFAALRYKLTGDKDAIKHVRANYCHKTVESVQQVKWLMQHYGQNEAVATKGGGGFKQSTQSLGQVKPVQPGFWTGPSAVAGNPKSTGKPTNRPASIWGA